MLNSPKCKVIGINIAGAGKTLWIAHLIKKVDKNMSSVQWFRHSSDPLLVQLKPYTTEMNFLLCAESSKVNNGSILYQFGTHVAVQCGPSMVESWMVELDHEKLTLARAAVADFVLDK